MLGEKLERWIRGDVRITVSEGFPILFMEACRKKKIRLRYLIVYTSGLEARIDRKDLDAVFGISAQLGMHTEAEEQKGLLPYLRRYRRRYGIPAGILCAAAILSVLSSFVWSVEIEGTEMLSKEAFAAQLKAAGLSQGVFLCNVDTGAIERETEAFDPIIKKVSVNLIGCRAFVRVWERTLPPAITEEGVACDLVAAKGGEIVKADITAGTPLVHAGDAVRCGDLLAEGAVLLKNGGTRSAAANGIVIARTKIPVLCELHRRQTVCAVIRSRKKYGFILFGCEFPLHGEKKQNGVLCMNGVSYLKAGNTVFPVGVRTADLLYCRETKISLTQAQAVLICADDLARRSAAGIGDSVVEQRIERLREGDVTALNATYNALENIAVQKRREPVQDSTH